MLGQIIHYPSFKMIYIVSLGLKGVGGGPLSPLNPLLWMINMRSETAFDDSVTVQLDLQFLCITKRNTIVLTSVA